MTVEDDADRASLLDDFGVAVRIYPGGLPVDRRALYDGPGAEIGSIASEIDMIELEPSLEMIAAEVAGLAIGDRVEVLEGPGLGDYIAKRVVPEDDGAFARVSLGER